MGTPGTDHAASRRAGLRRAVLAVSVLDDVVVDPADDGVRLGASWDDPRRTHVPWSLLDGALAGADPASPSGRLRLRDWLRVRAQLLERAGGPDAPVRRRVGVLALPAGHALHPGPTWVRERVLGGLLDLGLALHPDGDGAPRVLATSALADAGLDGGPWWPALRTRLDELGGLAAARLARDGLGVLAPTGGADVLTLLAAPALRRHLATGDGTGMRAVAVPMRTRGWFDLARIDPAFVAAAAAATDDEHRGVRRPLLVTTDEVALAPAAAPRRVAQVALLDLAAAERDLAPVRWR